MAASILTQDFVLSAIEAEKSGTEFPINFNDVWSGSGYSRKDHAVRFLEKRLKANEDYRSPDRGSVLSQREIFLSVDGFKFFLAKSNTEQGDLQLRYLIEIEKAYLRSLEAALVPTPSPIAHLERSLAASQQQSAELKEALDRFPCTLERLHKTSGIVSKSQVQRALKASFIRDRDWMIADGAITMNESTFHILIASFRSAAGTDLSDLPKVIELETEAFFRHQRQKMINSRLAKRDICDGQMGLEFDDLSA